ncbi:DNA/RNA helicase, superfamily II [Synechococcus sp. PCC 7502]|uniref:DEAD/DEAH box helicase n=1 Tax=Synechococcus sp. PCC 7502 TaxID=1173263 RepID=UPI00029FDB80|nr:DEAD/DEAH box helicase [Synechococcus sp. PCC 7502]AFY74938.1 DNA/RNA helicase, superfamily II [Synechococcus sp. PCC 7502]
MPSSFQSLGISEARIQVLTELGFTAPTPIQSQSIPALLEGKDMLGQAQTGTGKTAAFSLPILERIDPYQNQLQALILTPTRELAIQVSQAIRSFNLKPGAKILTVYGGQAIDRQISQLDRGVHIVVGTPGRVIDLMDRGRLDLSHLSWFVLDEADEMLNMGFIQDVEKILAVTPPQRQTAFFSATMPTAVKRLVKNYLRSPVLVKVESDDSAPSRIEQQVYIVPPHLSKEEALLPILELEAPHSALIFVRTKDAASKLTDILQNAGHSVDEYHGNLTQVQREGLLRRFRSEQVRWVVATDIAARGLDIDSLTHVINLDMPDDLERYVHRIGRTGRAGRTGTAITIISARERYKLRHLEKMIGQTLDALPMPTITQIQERRIARFKEQIHEVLTGERLASFLPLVSQLSEDYDPQAIAAAALQLAYSRIQSEKSEQAALNILSKQADKSTFSGSKPVKRSTSSTSGRRNYDNYDRADKPSDKSDRPERFDRDRNKGDYGNKSGRFTPARTKH